MARFEEQDFTDAEFRECDLTRVRLIGVVMQDAVIDGLISNLVVNGFFDLDRAARPGSLVRRA